jgi:hypothetical protein
MHWQMQKALGTHEREVPRLSSDEVEAVSLHQFFAHWPNRLAFIKMEVEGARGCNSGGDGTHSENRSAASPD